MLNILSSVVMPLHKIDYYDEDEIARLETAGIRGGVGVRSQKTE